MLPPALAKVWGVLAGMCWTKGPVRVNRSPPDQIVDRPRIDDVQFLALMCVKRRALAGIYLT
jgi:hypothetical protein